MICELSVVNVYRGTNINLKINWKSNHNTTLYIIVENMWRLNFVNNLHDGKVIYLELEIKLSIFIIYLIRVFLIMLH